MPVLSSLAATQWLGEPWQPIVGYVVGLHAQPGGWALAKRIVRSSERDALLVLEREPSNVHDSNAVAVFHGSGSTREQLGYLEAACAAQVSPALAAGLPLVARITGSSPVQGRSGVTRAGALEVTVVQASA